MEEIKMKKMLTVMAGIVAAGSLMSGIARVDVIVGKRKSGFEFRFNQKGFHIVNGLHCESLLTIL